MRFSKDFVKNYVQLKYLEAEQEKARRRLRPNFHVFISYSKVDRSIALEISKLLAEMGIPYFFDEKDIGWGKDVTKTIGAALTASTHVIVILSPTSVGSSWVSFEVGQAEALGKTILPYVTDSTVKIPGFLERWHYKTRIDEVSDFFKTLPLDREDLEELYGVVMSRLPGLDSYLYSSKESYENKDVWICTESGSNCPVGRIEIEGEGSKRNVVIDHVRAYGDSSVRDHHVIRYDDLSNEIVAEDTVASHGDLAANLGIGGSTYDRRFTWPASVFFWEAMVELLKTRLPARRQGDA